MVKYAEECRALGLRYIFDPGQQCARSTAEELRAGIVGAYILVLNNYEMELVRQKTGLDERAILEQSTAVIVTRGEEGSSIYLADRRIDVPAVPPAQVADPTGVGDAFRAGFMKGLAIGADFETCGRLGSVAATYALEHLGGQSHRFTWAEFVQRYRQQFGELVEAARA